MKKQRFAMKNPHAGWLVLVTFILSLFFPTEPKCQDNCNKKLEKKDEKIYTDGISSFKKGNYTMARISMKSILNSEPEFPDAWFVMGLTYYKLS